MQISLDNFTMKQMKLNILLDEMRALGKPNFFK